MPSADRAGGHFAETHLKVLFTWRSLGRFWGCLLAVAAIVGVTLSLLQPRPPQQVMAPAAAPAVQQQLPSSDGDRAAGLVAGTVSTGQIARPDPALLEAGPHGPLPRIAADGRTSMRVYARPVGSPSDLSPRVGLIIGGIGLNTVLSEQAIARLPPQVSIAINPYAQRLSLISDQVREGGFETLLALPLESNGHPLNDAGDRALLTSLSPTANEDRLFWALSRFQGYVGVIGALGLLRGERFAAMTEPFMSMQNQLRQRGLLYIDPRSGARNPERVWGRSVDVIVDEPSTRNEIDLKLSILERLARERGTSVGLVTEAAPVVIDRVEAWAAGLQRRGVMLVPISSLIRRPETTQ